MAKKILSTASVFLKPGREKSLLRMHPWIFSGAIDRLNGQPGDGETVEVKSSQGEFLAWGAYSHHSNIRVRVWSWNPDEKIDPGFIYQRIKSAVDSRNTFFEKQQMEAFRLVHAESDGFPGLVVDRYGEFLSVQVLSSGAEFWLAQIVEALQSITGLENIYERSDVDVRRLEGLAERTGVLRGMAPPARLSILEYGLQMCVDLRKGHKTGYYLDQRRNRLVVRSLAAGRRVLDCFCYSGGFSLNALVGGAASLTLVDASAEALELARTNLENIPRSNNLSLTEAADNRLPIDDFLASDPPLEFIEGDVFQHLRQMRDRARSFDLIILDPPKFAPTSAQVERATRGYKDINLLAFKLLAPGGLLVTFSCSGGVSGELFQKIVAGAALDAGVEAQILERLSQDKDHPVALNFPEGEYLKGLVVRVL